MTTFNELGLHPELVQAVTERGYTEATSIQEAVIPLLLAGKDIIGQAQTGTGKTAAFSLPLLHLLTPGAGMVQGLVMAPTRELAIQVAETMEAYGRVRGVRILAVYGGQPYGPQIGALRRGVDVVVGTPGRLLDLLKRNVLDLSGVGSVVLDEADEMLSMGFVEDIETILEATPADRQTALFSATLPRRVRYLADKYLNEPEAITIERKQMTVSTIAQRYYLVNREDKLAALTRLFETEELVSAIIFARTRAGTAELANELTIRGFPAEMLNGDLSQDAREKVLNRFRNTQLQVLVATDVAARGLDIDDISHVFNFDLPDDPEVYVHRVGRTGRAGRSGTAITLVTPRERWRLRKIEQYARQKIERAELPSAEAIQDLRDERLVEKVTVWLKRGRARREREMVESMLAEGFDPVEVAAAAMKVARTSEKQRPIPPIGEVVEGHQRGKGRGHRKGNPRQQSERRPRGKNGREQGMVAVKLSAGKAQGIRVNDVVGTIAYHADIPGRVLGKIKIHGNETVVDVPQQYVEKVLSKSGEYRIHRQRIEAVAG